MNVLYIYHEYGGRRKAYGYEIAKCGHTVSFLKIDGKTNPDQVTLKKIKSYKPDLVWLLSPHYLQFKVIQDDAYDYLKRKKIPIVLYSTLFTNVPYTEMMNLWKKFDFLFVHNRPFNDHLNKKGLKSWYMPVAFYPEHYFYCNQTKKIDVAFMGNPQSKNVGHDKRLRFVTELKEFDFKLFGGRWRKVGIKAPRFSTHEEQRIIYSMTKINLDLPYVNSPHEFYENFLHLKNRFFEIPATGNFLLTGKDEDFMDILDETMVGYYDNNIESLKDNIKRYLKDVALREKMSQRAHKVITENHTFGHRFREMFKILKKEGVS